MDTEELAQPTEEQKVLKWREEELVDLGIDRLDARELAESGSDMHLMKGAIQNGCSLSLLRRIFL